MSLFTLLTADPRRRRSTPGDADILCASGAVALLLGALLLPSSAARAQQLLTLAPGVAQAASAGDPGSMGPAPAAVEVDLDLLRSAPWRLEAPTPDGSVLVAERSVFEDRGGGDLMWSGGQPGAGYDTVVLTVEGGRLVGRFGAAGGGAYGIHAERDGFGGMAPIFGPSLEGWCGVDSMAEEAHAGHSHGAAWASAGAAAADLPERVSSPQGHDRLDILVAYTATAAENWGGEEAALAAIRHAGDYLKMVFRNNRIGVEPHIVHIARASAALDRAGREHLWDYYGYTEGTVGRTLPLTRELRWDGDLEYLRHVHRADLVHLFVGEPSSLLGACGAQALLKKGATAAEIFSHRPGWTTIYPTVCADDAVIFVHEIGHALGAHHDPANVGLPEKDLFRPYAYGHGNYDVMPSLGTVMSYRGQREPFFSTPRLRRWGAVLGVANRRDNERLLRETVHIVARSSDYLRSLEGVPAPPSELRVWYDRGAAQLSWRDNAPGADGYELVYSPEDLCCADVVTLEGRARASIPLEHAKPGARYHFSLRARKGNVRSLRSSIVRLVVPGEPIAAPSGVSVAPILSAFSDAEVRWTDNSDNETAFDVQILLDGEPIQQLRVEADSERATFGRWGEVRTSGRVDYEARVFAYNSSGYSESSETVPFRWANPFDPPPPAGLSASAIGPTTVRVSWIAAPDAAAYSVHAALRGWEDRRRWYRSAPSWTAGGRAYIDFENLARGGEYRFLVAAGRTETIADGPRSRAYLTFGRRGEGPSAPSDFAYVQEGNRASLIWKDNSHNETGFEVQYTGTPLASGRQQWKRLLTVPADTESVADYWIPINSLGDVFRVFAYNERGYSASSLGVAAGVPPEASFRLSALCEEQLCWTLPGERVVFTDTSSNTAERRWSFGDGATSTLPSPNHAWSSPGLYTVTLTVSNRWGRDSAPREVLVGPTPPFGTCRASPSRLCLWGSRFEMSAFWESVDGAIGRALVVNEGTAQSGLFRFFDPLNWEILIKVLDGCDENGRMWVLGASTTDLGYRIEVTDTVTGESREYVNEPGQPAPAIIDTDAFACAGGAAGR